jgi:hypothetical protein
MDGLWDHCLRHFEKELPPQQFRTWIQPLQALSRDRVLTITAPNRFVLQWVKDRFLPVIEQLTREATPHRVAVVLQLADTPASGALAASGPLTMQPPAEPVKPKVREHTRLNSSFIPIRNASVRAFVGARSREERDLRLCSGDRIRNRIERDRPMTGTDGRGIRGQLHPLQRGAAVRGTFQAIINHAAGKRWHFSTARPVIRRAR